MFCHALEHRACAFRNRCFGCQGIVYNIFTTFSLMLKLRLQNVVEKKPHWSSMYVPAVCALTVISLRRIFMRTTNYSSCIWKCRVTFERYSDMLIAMANLSNDTPQVSSSLTCIHSFVMGMLLKSWRIDGSIASWGLASKLLQTALPCWIGGEQ